jgi:signal transduction histidine kinase
MRIPIRLRLTISFLVVLLIGMGLAAALAWGAVERLYLTTQKENLIAQARLTAAAIQDTALPVEPTVPYMQTMNVMPGVHTRLLSEGGAVIVGLPEPGSDSPVQVPVAENAGFIPSDELILRPEIREALDGTPTAVVRRVASAEGQRVLYAAAPIYDDIGEVTGIVYLATPLPGTGLPMEIIFQFAGTVLIAVTLASLTGGFLARGIAQPVENLDRAAQIISAGELEQVVPTEYSITELERLSKSFNEMSASLSRTNQAKNAFIADVTHELRTPLTVIKGTIETLEDGALDDLEGRDPLLASMGREADRLIRLVNDLLVLTRADASALQLKIGPLEMASLARSRCEHMNPLAAVRKVELRVTTPDQLTRFYVMGDPDRLAQVLDNLLDNAIRYAPEGSTVTIEIQKTGDEIRTNVIDRGVGIPEEHLPYIFERFYRVEPSRNRRTGGTGLGLAIVKALVAAQNGRVDVESIPGEKTGFSFWLPINSTATELPEN